MAPNDLLPPNFVKEGIDLGDLKITCIAFGFTLGFGYLTAVKAAGQSISIYRRTHRITVTYTMMIWLELLVSIMFAILTWLYVDNVIPPGFAIYFSLGTLPSDSNHDDR
jgi:Na+-driven multidrug efflux pump